MVDKVDKDKVEEVKDEVVDKVAPKPRGRKPKAVKYVIIQSFNHNHTNYYIGEDLPVFEPEFIKELLEAKAIKKV